MKLYSILWYFYCSAPLRGEGLQRELGDGKDHMMSTLSPDWRCVKVKDHMMSTLEVGEGKDHMMSTLSPDWRCVKVKTIWRWVKVKTI
jgi:hypothetical protein